MRIEGDRAASGFEALAAEWNSLLKRCPSDTPFLTWEWQHTWWTYLGEGELWLIAMRDESSGLAGLAPLYRTIDEAGRASLSIVGCVDVSDYLDIIADGEQTEAVYAALLDFLGSDDAPPWDVIELCNIPHTSPTHGLMPKLAMARGYNAHTQVEDVCPVIDLPPTWDEYLASLDKKQRHEVRRKARRAQREAEVRWYIVDSSHDLSSETEAFIELHQQSNVDKDDFMDEQMKTFFRAMIQAMYEAGWLQLAFIELDGQKAATILNFDYGNDILVYNSGYDPHNHAHLSPGMVLMGYCIQHAIELGREKFDFLRGNEEYKYRLGGRDTEVYRVTISRGSAVAAPC